ncbi:MAG: LamG domain-containing protein [Armatimonadetes bacterium]|nr:LamG domain-containing protein [Armatimonadota bacterium]
MNAEAAQAELIGYWPLREDSRDHSGAGGHGEARHVAFTVGEDGTSAACFNGSSSEVVIPDAPARDLGQEFSLSAWIYTETDLGDTLGDLASRYDPATRCGFQLSLLNFAGVTNAHANQRNLHFGLDAARGGHAWQDCGRPGAAIYVCALCVSGGHLYAGTYEQGASEAGHVYVYAGKDHWEDCGSPDPCNSVTALAEYEGVLYAGVSRYRAAGSALEESRNPHPGGRIYRYEGGRRWTDCGKLGGPDSTAQSAAYGESLRRFAGWSPDEVDSVHNLTVFQGRLYAIPIYHQGLYRYEGGVDWSDCGSPGVRLMSLTGFRDHLYGAGNEGNQCGGVYRYDGERRWYRTGNQPGVTQTYSFLVYQAHLYVGTWPEATVFRYDGGEQWSHCGRLGEELEVMGMAAYNGQFYAGTLPLAQVYRYQGGRSWELSAQLDHTPDVRFRRAWSMAVYQGRLFCGTLPSGHVFSLEAGINVTHDHALRPGWVHVAAVRASGRLRLFVDGLPVAESRPLRAEEAYPAPPGLPLRLGSGPHDFFRGRMRDVRLYRRALSTEDVQNLMTFMR